MSRVPQEQRYFGDDEDAEEQACSEALIAFQQDVLRRHFGADRVDSFNVTVGDSICIQMLTWQNGIRIEVLHNSDQWQTEVLARGYNGDVKARGFLSSTCFRDAAIVFLHRVMYR